MPDDQKKSSGKYLLDVESAPELVRLMAQGDGATRAMGWLLPPGISQEPLMTVLDLGCGPGGWVLDLAFAYPEAEVAGVDISQSLMQYARARARSQGLRNASFEVMDLTEPLAFSDASFDLVNLRFVVGTMRKEQWPTVLAEVHRILRPGGWVIVTEGELGDTTSPAAATLMQVVSRAMQANGQSFDPHGQRIGITVVLESLVRQMGFQQVQCQPHLINFSSWSQDSVSWCTNLHIIFTTIRPLIIRQGLSTEQEYTRLLHAFEIEMNQEWFSGVAFFLSVWGKKAAPVSGES